MTHIAKLPAQAGQRVAGTYRLLATAADTGRSPSPSTSRLTVADATGRAVCRVAMPLGCLRQMLGERTRFVRVTGKVNPAGSDETRLDATQVISVTTLDQPSWQLLPRHWVPPQALDAFDRLRALLGRLHYAPIQAFAHRLFASQSVAEPFLCVPASRHHHHAGPGGLLMHSVECGEVAEAMSRHFLADHERDLAMIGALLHDIAKIRILVGRDTARQAIYGVTQEALNLEVLAPFLRTLDAAWPAGGAGLREMLAPARHTGAQGAGSPLLLTDFIRYIDRLSSGADIRRQRFRRAAAWQRCTRTAQGTLIARVLPAAPQPQQVVGPERSE